MSRYPRLKHLPLRVPLRHKLGGGQLVFAREAHGTHALRCCSVALDWNPMAMQDACDGAHCQTVMLIKCAAVNGAAQIGKGGHELV